jgi:beta-hydroxylase
MYGVYAIAINAREEQRLPAPGTRGIRPGGVRSECAHRLGWARGGSLRRAVNVTDATEVTSVSKSLWERTVDLTISVGERILAPVERFIGKRSLVGDATFFPLERFPWVEHIEANWEVIREEAERLLEDREGLANFQDISKDQIEITDDDRWKTFFLYGYGFEAKLGVEMCPKTAALMREIPGMTTAMFSILSPRKHILDHRGPYKGVLRYHLGLVVPEDAESCRIRVGEDFRHWEAGESMVFDDTFNHEVWNDTDDTRVVLFVDVLRPLPEPEATINRWIVKAIGWSPFVLDAKRNQEAWEERYRERRPPVFTAGDRLGRDELHERSVR